MRLGKLQPQTLQNNWTYRDAVWETGLLSAAGLAKWAYWNHGCTYCYTKTIIEVLLSPIRSDTFMEACFSQPMLKKSYNDGVSFITDNTKQHTKDCTFHSYKVSCNCKCKCKCKIPKQISEHKPFDSVLIINTIHTSRRYKSEYAQKFRDCCWASVSC